MLDTIIVTLNVFFDTSHVEAVSKCNIFPDMWKLCPSFTYFRICGSFVPVLHIFRYVDAVSQFGDLIEVRSGRRNQEHPIFVRMLDKSSNFQYTNGLKTLTTTLLHFGNYTYFTNVQVH